MLKTNQIHMNIQLSIPEPFRKKSSHLLSFSEKYSYSDYAYNSPHTICRSEPTKSNLEEEHLRQSAECQESLCCRQHWVLTSITVAVTVNSVKDLIVPFERIRKVW